jgi:hypothetical protein
MRIKSRREYQQASTSRDKKIQQSLTTAQSYTILHKTPNTRAQGNGTLNQKTTPDA